MSCLSRTNPKIEVVYDEIKFPDFPYFEEIREEENEIVFIWENEEGTLPKEWFYALAEYVNSVDAIKAYIYFLNNEDTTLPP